jgi:hypothetical protein
MRGIGRILIVALAAGWGLLVSPRLGVTVSARPAASTSKPRGSRPARAITPEILLTGATRETRAVEARLAAFVRAVRRRDGARAARFLARETPPPVRMAVARRDWPWRTASQDLAPLFAAPRLRLHTVGLRGRRARVRIGPQRVISGGREGSGFYDVGMVREGARWQVKLPRSAAPRIEAGRQP